MFHKWLFLLTVFSPFQNGDKIKDSEQQKMVPMSDKTINPAEELKEKEAEGLNTLL